LERIDFEAVLSRGYSFQEEILWRLKRLGARMAETPITFADRERGSSKINMHEAFAALGILARLGAKNWLGLERQNSEARRQKKEDAGPAVKV
jgi:dolichol-phosphate mannosyltransferase